MIQLLFVVLLWVMPTIFLTNAYMKMDEEEKQKFKGEFKQPVALLGAGLIIIGLLLLFTGIILAIEWIQHIGAIMVFISWFTVVIVSWVKGKTGYIRSAILILLGVSGITIYGFLHLY